MHVYLFLSLFFQVKGPLSVPSKDVAGHSQHLILERFTSGHIQAKGLITVQSQDVGELLPVQLIIRIMWEYTQVYEWFIVFWSGICLGEAVSFSLWTMFWCVVIGYSHVYMTWLGTSVWASSPLSWGYLSS